MNNPEQSSGKPSERQETTPSKSKDASTTPQDETAKENPSVDASRRLLLGFLMGNKLPMSPDRVTGSTPDDKEGA